MLLLLEMLQLARFRLAATSTPAGELQQNRREAVGVCVNGCLGRTRTYNLGLQRAQLYQLRYEAVNGARCWDRTSDIHVVDVTLIPLS